VALAATGQAAGFPAQSDRSARGTGVAAAGTWRRPRPQTSSGAPPPWAAATPSTTRPTPSSTRSRVASETVRTCRAGSPSPGSCCIPRPC